ncbi:hypothetical protein ACFQ49_11345 [Kroppenstedtia eburnea]
MRKNYERNKQKTSGPKPPVNCAMTIHRKRLNRMDPDRIVIAVELDAPRT